MPNRSRVSDFSLYDWLIDWLQGGWHLWGRDATPWDLCIKFNTSRTAGFFFHWKSSTRVTRLRQMTEVLSLGTRLVNAVECAYSNGNETWRTAVTLLVYKCHFQCQRTLPTIKLSSAQANSSLLPSSSSSSTPLHKFASPLLELYESKQNNKIPAETAMCPCFSNVSGVFWHL